jgi:hypothetical protein
MEDKAMISAMRKTFWLSLLVGLTLGVQARAATVVLQPGAEGKDAAVWMSYSSYPEGSITNWGDRDRLMACSASIKTRRTFIEFDLSGVSMDPNDVLSVKLGMVSWQHHNSGPSGEYAISLYKVTEEWVEGPILPNPDPSNPNDDVTFNNQPATAYPPIPVATLITADGCTTEEMALGGKWLVWDSEEDGNEGLLNLVKGWLAETTDNFGLMVAFDDETQGVNGPNHWMHSSDFDYINNGYGPLGWDFNPLPKLEISDSGGPALPIPGDANRDDVVDEDDASILAAHWQDGPDMNWSDGDFNSDGYVNDEDAAILAAHWLETGEGNTAPVPEPFSGVLLASGLAAAIALAAMRRRRK